MGGCRKTLRSQATEQLWSSAMRQTKFPNHVYIVLEYQHNSLDIAVVEDRSNLFFSRWHPVHNISFSLEYFQVFNHPSIYAHFQRLNDPHIQFSSHSWSYFRSWFRFAPFFAAEDQAGNHDCDEDNTAQNYSDNWNEDKNGKLMSLMS